ncbi:hypothetical protein VDG1235_467 [Verrucomicrobiia bacterium DG1235]|nr:hypothetical protein VDG1235_467 [Verrucomicrobiae bacterium DG1235]
MFLEEIRMVFFASVTVVKGSGTGVRGKVLVVEVQRDEKWAFPFLAIKAARKSALGRGGAMLYRIKISNVTV